jgi:hypothetical protein
VSPAPDATALLPSALSQEAAATLRSASTIATFTRTLRLSRLDTYYRGTQYDAREYGWDGRHLASSEALGGFAPFYPDWIVPLDLRRPPANYLVGRVIVDRFTSLLFGNGSFPEIIVEGDPETEDFLRATSTAAALPERMTHARNLGGAQGTVVLSYAWVDGLPVVDVHAAMHVLVLRWADTQRHVPHHVLKIWPTSEPAVNAKGELVEQEGWMAREWCGPIGDAAGYERVYLYTPPERDRPAYWSIVAEAPLTECTVVWIRNEPVDDRHDGEGDFEGSEDTIDELNTILGATSTGTAINADPTLVVKCDPKLNPGRTKKGAFNTIYSPGGAEYLELSGAAVKAGLENVERLRAYLFEQTGMTILDPEKMSGAAQSGEALRRLMAPTLAKADRRRETYGAGIVQVLTGLWRLARRIEDSAPVEVPVRDSRGAPVLDEAGAPVIERRKASLRLPPRHERTTERGENGLVTTSSERVVERRPGKGGTVTLKWPEYFPPSEQDKLAKVTTIQAANGGHPVLSPTNAIRAAAPIFGNPANADEELTHILDGARLFAEAAAGSIGVRDPDVGEPPPPSA